jgi:hypothetical protein
MLYVATASLLTNYTASQLAWLCDNRDRQPVRLTFRKHFNPDLAVTVPFLVFLLIQIVHHQLWRDELNVYGIAHASPTLGSLLWRVNHEGHPLVWYLTIWLAMKAIPSVAVLKVIQFIVGSAIIVLVGLARPFTRIERVLLLLSYFVLFEYTVMSRLYGLCVLLAMLFLWRRVYRPDSFFVNTLLLCIMANTDTLGLFFSGAFGLEWIVSRMHERGGEPRIRWQAAGAVLLYCAAVAFCYVTIKPPADISWRTTGHIFEHGFEFNHLASVFIEYVELPWIPVRFGSVRWAGHNWNPISLEHQLLYPLLLPLVIAAYFLTFRRDRDLLAVFALASLGAAGFAFVVFTGNMRNWGITFVAYVAALWLQRFRRPNVPIASTILLASCAISGVIFTILMWSKPFSNAEAAARWLQDHRLQNAAIAGTPDTSVAAVAILMRRPIYFLDCRCSDSYMLFSSRRDKFNTLDWPKDTLAAFGALNTRQLILLLIAPMQPGDRKTIEQGGAEVQPLAGFSGAEAPDEDFFIYKVVRTSS